jgi:hypothetical protein
MAKRENVAKKGHITAPMIIPSSFSKEDHDHGI